MTEGGGPRQAPEQEPPEAEPPEAEPPSAIPDESTLTPAPVEDDGSLIPTQLPDAPEFIPTPMGMATGVIISSPAAVDVSPRALVTTAPERTAAGTNRLALVIGSVIAIVAVAVVGFILAGFMGVLPSDRGKVLFGTGRGDTLCHVANATSTLKASDPLFFAANLRDQLGGDATVTLRIAKDGTEILAYEDQQSGQPFACYGNAESLAPFDPGQYRFEVLYNGAVQAAGDVTIVSG